MVAAGNNVQGGTGPWKDAGATAAAPRRRGAGDVPRTHSSSFSLFSAAFRSSIVMGSHPSPPPAPSAAMLRPPGASM